jgi:DNA adenine methylase
VILRRLGNKKKLVNKILENVPKHSIYVEPFFGTGSVYFTKTKSNHNFLNDLDEDVFNLYYVTSNNWEELYNEIKIMPASMSLFKYWMKNKEVDPIKKALRFLFLSNFSYMGKGDCFKVDNCNSKNVLLNNMKNYKSLLINCHITNLDFRKFFKAIQWKSIFGNNSFSVFCYCDPPYINTTNNYSNLFTKQDTIDLFNILKDLENKYKNFYYAISEFQNEFVMDLAKERNLNINIIGERQSMKNRNTEILITNYKYESLKGIW